MNELERAKALLQSGSYTAVLCKGDAAVTTEQRGVKPLVCWVESGQDFRGYTAADKVVGRGAAFLYVLLGIDALYAAVLSESAREVLERYGIRVEYDRLVEHIVNRSGTGLCPFEQAVWNVCDADAAYSAILRKMQELHISLTD